MVSNLSKITSSLAMKFFCSFHTGCRRKLCGKILDPLLGTPSLHFDRMADMLEKSRYSLLEPHLMAFLQPSTQQVAIYDVMGQFVYPNKDMLKSCGLNS